MQGISRKLSSALRDQVRDVVVEFLLVQQLFDV